VRTIVLVNAGAGAVCAGAAPGAPAGGAPAPGALQRVREAVRAAGLCGPVRAVEPDALPQAVADAAAAPDVDAVIVAGGDGTVNCAASALAGGSKPLGVLPLGTLNHFARDLGLPSEPEEAAAALAAGHWKAVDVGEVNGRVFVNNCSVGLYPEAVLRREERRQVLGEKKWPAMARALREALRRMPVVRLTLCTDDRKMRVATPLLVVGNNRYETDLLNLGRREALDEGRLWVYLARADGMGGVLRLAARTLMSRLEQARDFESLSTRSLEVVDRRRWRRLATALDGEVVALASPLRLRIRPRALRVLVPPDPP
jgi:diacylglycerol kinase family enzyme